MHGTSRDSLAAVQQRLLDRAAQAGSADAARAFATAADELLGVAGVLAGQGSLRRALSDPALPAERRRGLVESLFGGKVGEVALDVLTDVAERRWSRPADVVDTVEILGIQAAFTVAEVDSRLGEVEDEIFRFQRIVTAEPSLRAALTDRGTPVEAKVGLLQGLLGQKVAPTTLQLVTYVVRHPRGRTFEGALEELGRLAAQRRERLVARVTSARALDTEQQRRLADALQGIYGREVQLQLEVQPALVGGVVVRVGDEVIDGSVVRRLDDARRRLAG